MIEFGEYFLDLFTEDSIQHDGVDSSEDIVLRGDAGQYIVTANIHDDEGNEEAFSDISTNTINSSDARDRHIIIKKICETINSLKNMGQEEFNTLTEKLKDPKYSFNLGEKGTGSSSTGGYFINKQFLFTM